MSDSTLVYAVRHGETLWNTQGRLQGHQNSALSPRGEAQAQALGRALQGQRFDALYCSDLGRAKQTAALISAHVEAPPVQTLPELRERSYGALEGLTWDEVEARFPDVPVALIRGGPDTVPPGGEALEDFVERGHGALTQLARKHPGEKLLIVSHGGVLATFLRRVLGVPQTAAHTFQTRNCALNIFGYQDDRWLLKTWGAASHLSED